MACKLIGTGIEKFEGEKLYYSTGSIKDNDFIPEGLYNFNNKPSRANRIAIFGELIDAKMQGTLKIQIIDERLAGSLLSTGFYVLKNYINNLEYFKFLISSNYFQQTKDKKCSGTTQKAITDDELSKIIIPLPPLEEQQRIVDKINSFEPLLEKYNKTEKELSKLESKFSEKLKKSILQYAVEGKLVKQDPNDEPASVLLERIKVEKEKLIKECKIKRDKNESYIYQGDDKNYYEKIGNKTTKLDLPFDNDETCWTKLKNIAFITKLAGFEYSKYISPNLTSNGIPLFKGKNVQNSCVIYKFENYIPLEISNQLIRSQITNKCLLTPYVGSIGNVGIHDKPGIFHLGSNVGKIELYNNFTINIMEEYVFYYLKSYTGYYELLKFKKATAQESISIDAIRETLIPIYSLRVQKQIHKKIQLLYELI